MDGANRRSGQAGGDPADGILCRSWSRTRSSTLLGTQASGLSEAEAEDAPVHGSGPNRIEECPGPSWVRRLARPVHPSVRILLWAGAPSRSSSGQPGIGIAIIAVIVLNGVFGFLQENRAERAVAELKRLLPAVADGVIGTARSAGSRPRSWCRATSSCSRRGTASRPTRG